MGEEHNQREDKDEHSKAAFGGDLHGLEHYGLPWLRGDCDDEGHPAQNRGRVFLGGQLEGLRPEENRADYHRRNYRRGRRGGEYLIESVEHTLDIQEGFITRCHLIRNFCEVNDRSGTASEIDRERADSQINGTQEENSLVASAGGSKAENQSDLENTSNEKNPKIMNPHWEAADGQTIAKALVGDEVYLCADVTDIADGATAKLKIVEKDDDGDDDDLTVLTDKVQDGKIRCDWKVVYMEDNDDTESQKEMEEKGYTLPEYAFNVECDGVESEESRQLDVLGWIKTQFKDKENGLPVGNKKFRIFSFDGKIKIDGSTDENGYADLRNINISKYYIFWEKDEHE